MPESMTERAKTSKEWIEGDKDRQRCSVTPAAPLGGAAKRRKAWEPLSLRLMLDAPCSLSVSCNANELRNNLEEWFPVRADLDLIHVRGIPRNGVPRNGIPD